VGKGRASALRLSLAFVRGLRRACGLPQPVLCVRWRYETKLQMGFPFVTSVPFWVGSEGALLLAVRSKWLCSPASTLLRGAILTKLTILNLEGCEFSSHVIAEGVVGDPQLPRGYLWVGEIVDFFVGTTGRP